MSEPKKKYPKSRQGKRRSHQARTLPSTEPCPQCHNVKLSHHVCPSCGSYNGKVVIEVKSKK